MQLRKVNHMVRLVALLLLVCLTACQAVGQPKKPNILLIVADDVGYTDLGSYGSEIRTPRLDALAKNGVRFSDFHTGMTCSPTRAMLMSGVDHHLAGLGNMAEDLAPNQKGKPGYEGHLNFSVAALPEVLKANGYRTVMAGKWHLGMDEATSPAARSFDRSFSSLQGGAGHFSNMLPIVGPGKAKYREHGKMLDHLPGDFYSTRAFADKLIEYLKEGARADKEKPFFAYLAFTAPHWPIQAPDDSIARYRGTYDEGYDALFERRLAAAKKTGLIPTDTEGAPRDPSGKPWTALSAADREAEARRMEAFAAMISDIDSAVGKVLDYLEAEGELDNTIVMFMSDNGYEGHDLRSDFKEAAAFAQDCCDNSTANIGRPNSYVWMGPDWARASTAPFRVYKGYPTEGGTRVPFIISYNGLERKGLVHQRGHVTDIFLTILDLAGIAQPSRSFAGRSIHDVQGKSLVPYLSAKVDSIHGEGEVFAQELFGKRAIRIGRWKAVQMPAPYGNGRWQLFDLANDLSETRDLAGERPEELASLVGQWERWSKQTNVILPDWVSGY